MEQRDEQFESYLREFEPHHPRPLPAMQPAKRGLRRRLAAAAVVVIAAGSSLWFLSRKPAPDIAAIHAERATGTVVRQPLALLPLTRLALEDPGRLDAMLMEASRGVLPGLQRKDSALRALAKE
jgi:ferric-dicitrate binding protein FerR (iron transport regulator)